MEPLREVMEPLRTGTPFTYRRFDCSVMDFGGDSDPVDPAGNVIVEGSYALHPAFGALPGEAGPLRHPAELAVFLQLSPETQRERIRQRNGEEMLRRFEERWIPLENRYYAANRPRLEAVLYHLCEALRCCGILLNAYLPNTAPKMMDQLGLDASALEYAACAYGRQAAYTVHKGDALFPRIDVAKEIAYLKAEDEKRRAAAEAAGVAVAQQRGPGVAQLRALGKLRVGGPRLRPLVVRAQHIGRDDAVLEQYVLRQRIGR